MASPPAALCDRCLHQRRIENARGSVFSLCERSKTQPEYPRYPPLPVRFCTGLEQKPEPAREA